MTFISKLLNESDGKGLVASIGNIVDNLTTTKAEKLQLGLELNKAQWQYQTETQKNKNQNQQNILQDKQSARKMASNVQTSQSATSLNKNISAYLALTTTLLSFALFFVILFFPGSLPDKGKDIIIYILGVLSAIITQVFSFYFGASLKQDDNNTLSNKFPNHHPS
jgi:ATP-dependent Zn protease